MTERSESLPGLSADDAAVFDQLAAEGFDPSRADEASHHDRAQAAINLLGLLDAYPADAPTDEECQTLVDATMARIRRDEEDRRDRMRMDNHPVMLGRGLRFRIAEGLAVAAVLAMATATLWSFGTTARQRAMSASARHNLSELHAGLSAFKDATGEVPLQDASPGVGRLLNGRSASQLDLGTVTEAGYCDPACLANPRRLGTGRNGFSFAVVAPGDEGHLDHAMVVLIGDRNPALGGLLAGRSYDDAMTETDWHSRLVNEPSVVFADGHTEDLQGESHEGDGIWSVDPTPGPAPIEIFLAH